MSLAHNGAALPGAMSRASAVPFGSAGVSKSFLRFVVESASRNGIHRHLLHVALLSWRTLAM